jgi:ubiquinone/menaquinone biosynthesis C-methylase UbiE
LNAWLLVAIDGFMHERYGKLKASLFGAVPATVVEIGPGAGANFRYYPVGTRVIAVEPNRWAHERLRRRASDRGIELELLPTGAEWLPLPSNSADLVVATLVLCSVADPAAVLREARRVLGPGGRFVCIEHVAAPAGTLASGLQRLLARPWRWLFEGCELTRDTASLIRGAGFSTVEVRELRLPALAAPVGYQIAATCTVSDTAPVDLRPAPP